MRPVIALIIPKVAEAVAARIVPGMVPPEIEASKLGVMECAIGAATIAHHHALDISHVEVQPSV